MGSNMPERGAPKNLKQMQEDMDAAAASDVYWIKGNQERYNALDKKEKAAFEATKTQAERDSIFKPARAGNVNTVDSKKDKTPLAAHLRKMDTTLGTKEERNAKLTRINKEAKEAWRKEGVREETERRWTENEKTPTLTPEPEPDNEKNRELEERVKKLEEEIDKLKKKYEQEPPPEPQPDPAPAPEPQPPTPEPGPAPEPAPAPSPELQAANLREYTAIEAAKKAGVPFEKAEGAKTFMEKMTWKKRLAIYSSIALVAAGTVAGVSWLAAPWLAGMFGTAASGWGGWSALMGTKVAAGVAGYQIGSKGMFGKHGVSQTVFGRKWFGGSDKVGALEHANVKGGYNKAMRKLKNHEAFIAENPDAKFNLTQEDMRKFIESGYDTAKWMPAVASLAVSGAGYGLYHGLYQNWDAIAAHFSGPDTPAGTGASAPPTSPPPVASIPGGAVEMGWPTEPVGANGGPPTPLPDTAPTPADTQPPAAEVTSVANSYGPDSYTINKDIGNVSDGIEKFAELHGVKPDASSIGLYKGESVNLLTDVIRDQQRVAMGDITTVAQNGLIDSNLNFLKEPAAIDAMKESLKATVANEAAVNQAIADLDKLHAAAKLAPVDITIHVGN